MITGVLTVPDRFRLCCFPRTPAAAASIWGSTALASSLKSFLSSADFGCTSKDGMLGIQVVFDHGLLLTIVVVEG
jgi:hypothetical protein